MDSFSSKDGHFDADLEKGGVKYELDSRKGLVLGTVRMKQLYSEASSGALGSCDKSIKNEERVVSSIVSRNGDGFEYVRSVVVDKRAGEGRDGDALKKKIVKEKPKAMSAKKPPKPPRPPRGLSLDSADQKLIRELHELTKLKRARIERMKALKKAKEAKLASSKNQLLAALLTILFCLVVLLQGISTRTNSTTNFQGSPTSSGRTEGGILSVQHYPVASARNVNGPGSEPPRLVQQVSGLDTPEHISRAVG